MTGSRRFPFLLRRRSYAVYSIGVAVAWAAVWAAVVTIDSHTTETHVLWLFLGWLIGWVSASIARLVYPPPRHGPAARYRNQIEDPGVRP